jgi:hypothetical protein
MVSLVVSVWNLLGNVDGLWTGALLVCDNVFIRNLLGEVGALCMYVKVLCAVRLWGSL